MFLNTHTHIHTHTRTPTHLPIHIYRSPHFRPWFSALLEEAEHTMQVVFARRLHAWRATYQKEHLAALLRVSETQVPQLLMLARMHIGLAQRVHRRAQATQNQVSQKRARAVEQVVTRHLPLFEHRQRRR